MSPLNDLQLRTLVAAIDRIIPADDFPSASEAGCLDFLNRLIELEGLEDVYRNGLDSLEADAAKSGASFADLSSARQDELLKKSEAVKKRAVFIRLLARQTIEGYYSDPGNGGNRNEIAWKMIGFEVRG